jgi:hypothetical protein
VPWGHWKTTTFVGALRVGEIAPCVFDRRGSTGAALSGRPCQEQIWGDRMRGVVADIRGIGSRHRSVSRPTGADAAGFAGARSPVPNSHSAPVPSARVACTCVARLPWPAERPLADSRGHYLTAQFWLPSLRDAPAKSLWVGKCAVTQGVRPTFQIAFFKTTFANSSPLTPATQSVSNSWVRG